MMKPKLRLPFNGNYPVSFAFGARPEDEEIKKKFSQWGIIGHHGIDYSLIEGTGVLACDKGKAIQAGDNGGFGVSVTLQHQWGQSLYGHLKKAKVNIGKKVKKGEVIGVSGKTGAAFGEHLHFGIKPNNPDVNNGYLGFINPSPYFKRPLKKPKSSLLSS